MSEIELWNEMGKIYFNVGAYEEAIHAYSKAIELDRGFGWPYSNLALTYSHEGKYAEAIPLYKKSIELLGSNRDKAISWNRLGDAYCQLKYYENAVAAYQKAVELDPDNASFRNDLSKIKIAMGCDLSRSSPPGLLVKPEDMEVIEMIGASSKNPQETSKVQDITNGMQPASTQIHHSRKVLRNQQNIESKNPKHPIWYSNRTLLLLRSPSRIRRKKHVQAESIGQSILESHIIEDVQPSTSPVEVDGGVLSTALFETRSLAQDTDQEKKIGNLVSEQDVPKQGKFEVGEQNHLDYSIDHHVDLDTSDINEVNVPSLRAEEDELDKGSLREDICAQESYQHNAPYHHDKVVLSSGADLTEKEGYFAAWLKDLETSEAIESSTKTPQCQALSEGLLAESHEHGVDSLLPIIEDMKTETSDSGSSQIEEQGTQEAETPYWVFNANASVVKESQPTDIREGEPEELKLYTLQEKSSPLNPEKPPKKTALAMEKPSNAEFPGTVIVSQVCNQDNNVNVLKTEKESLEKGKANEGIYRKNGYDQSHLGDVNVADSCDALSAFQMTEESELKKGTIKNNQSEVQNHCGQLDDDIATYKRVVEINPKNAFAWYTLGTLFKNSGRYDDAISAFENAVSLEPNKAFYHYHLGLVYAARKRYDDAIGAFQKVIKMDPENRLAHATLAGYYRKLGQESKAQNLISIALSTMKDENEYNRACFEAICGNVDQALELLRVALEQKQTSVDWARHDPDFDFIRDDPRFKSLVGESAGSSQQQHGDIPHHPISLSVH